MKRVIAAVILFGLCASLAGCSGGGGGSSAPASGPSQSPALNTPPQTLIVPPSGEEPVAHYVCQNNCSFPESYGGVPDGVTDSTDAIQMAIDNAQGREVFLSEGVWIVKNTKNKSVRYRSTTHYYSLQVPSGTKIRLHDLAILKQGAGTNAHLFTNKLLSDDPTKGDVDIEIVGGTFDLNAEEQSGSVSGEQSGALFHNITLLTLRDITFVNVKMYALRITGIRHGTFTNLVSLNSKGSAFAFGLNSQGWSPLDYGITDSVFDGIVAHNSEGTKTGVAPQGNGFIFHGARTTIISVESYGNFFGIKLQDGCKDVHVGRVIARDTLGDHAFKIQGSKTFYNDRVTVDSVDTARSWGSGVQIQYADNTYIQELRSESDGGSVSTYPAVLVSTGKYTHIGSAWITNGTMVVRPDAIGFVLDSVLYQ